MELIILSSIFTAVWLITTITFVVLYKKKQTTSTDSGQIKQVIANQGGEVVRVDNWGLKNLAYRIKKNRKGYYVLLNISAPATAVAEYERVMRVNEDIIRYMTVKVEDFSEASASSDGVDSAVEE